MMLRKRFDELVENAATAVFVFMFIVTAMQVILRFIFQRPLMWTGRSSPFPLRLADLPRCRGDHAGQ